MAEGHARASYLVKDRQGKLFRYTKDHKGKDYFRLDPGGRVEALDNITLFSTTPPTETYAYTHIFGIADIDSIPLRKKPSAI